MFPGSSGLSSEIVDSVFLFFLALCVALLVLITVLMVVFVVRYRRSRHPVAEQIKDNPLLEILWTAVPTVLVLCMFYWGWMGYRYLRIVPDDHMTVEVLGRKWSWSFTYENGKQATELRVPIGKPVKLLMTSQDVLHSFFVPAFRVKQDLVPGMETYLWFETDEVGTYDVLCAEYCGEQHSYMLSKVIALPQDEFDEWYGTADTGDVAQLLQLKGCVACHSVDGTALVGPTFQGIFGRKEVVVSAGGEEREVVVDEEYLRRSIMEPQAEIVKGYPPSMPPQAGNLSDEEVDKIIAYLMELQ